MGSKPHPHRDVIIKAAKAGVQPGLIARELSMKPQAIYNILSAARNKGHIFPRSKWEKGGRQSGSISIHFSAEDLEALAPHAERYSMTPKQLIQKVICTVRDENLFDAVLDIDGGAL